jgi:hypothetical protein
MDMLLEMLQKVLDDGLSWGLLITAYLVYRKHRRNRRLNARDARWEAKLDAIMKEVGATCADTCKTTTEPSAATRAGGSLSCWPGKCCARSAKPFMISNMRRTQTMLEEVKKYLKKLGRTKFQAYLLVTIINAITLYAHFRGWTKEQVQIDPYMPILNVIVQAVATMVYQWVEGSIDREAQKQQVYVMPGSAPATDETAAASSSGTTSGAASAQGSKYEAIKAAAAEMPWNEVIARVRAVNNELNDYMAHLENGKGGLSDIAKEAVSRYMAVHDFLSTKEPLPSAPEGGTTDAAESAKPVSGQH